jgi:hypothetical protein
MTPGHRPQHNLERLRVLERWSVTWVEPRCKSESEKSYAQPGPALTAPGRIIRPASWRALTDARCATSECPTGRCPMR